jgi:hypothetical protein
MHGRTLSPVKGLEWRIQEHNSGLSGPSCPAAGSPPESGEKWAQARGANVVEKVPPTLTLVIHDSRNVNYPIIG